MLHDISFQGIIKFEYSSDVHRWFWSYRMYHDENSNQSMSAPIYSSLLRIDYYKWKFFIKVAQMLIDLVI